MTDLGHIKGAIVIPNCVQVRLIWTLPNTKTVYNVLHGSVSGGFTATTAIAQAIYASVIASGAWTAWKPFVSATASLAGVDLRDERVANMPLVASTGGATAGTGAGGAIPPGDALCITLRTASVGRAFRGRVYLPALDFTALGAGGVLAAGKDALAVNFVTAVQTAMTASGLALGIAQPHRAAYTGKLGTPIAERQPGIAAVTSIVCRNMILDHQRRRAGRS